MVRAQAAGAGEHDLLDLVQARLVGCGAGESAGLLRGSAAGRDDIQAHHLHAGRDEEAHHELPDEPEPDNTRGLTKRDLGAADALHCDRPHRGERGVLGCNTIRYRDAQIRRHPVQLGVQGEFVARGRDHLTDRELLSTRTDLDHHAAQRIAERRVAVQPVHRFLVGGDGALLGHGVDQLADLIGPRSGLAEQGHPAPR